MSQFEINAHRASLGERSTSQEYMQLLERGDRWHPHRVLGPFMVSRTETITADTNTGPVSTVDPKRTVTMAGCFSPGTEHTSTGSKRQCSSIARM
jgi:hypothetical protein